MFIAILDELKEWADLNIKSDGHESYVPYDSLLNFLTQLDQKHKARIKKDIGDLNGV